MDIVDKIFKPVFNPILGPIMGIIDAMILLVKALIIIITAIPQLLMAALQILNPVSIINDSIIGVFMSIKILLVNMFGFFKPKKGPYNKCKDNGSGIFGFRRKRNSEGKKVGGDCGDKGCYRPLLVKYLIVVLCPPLGLFLHMGAAGWFHIIISSILTVYGMYFPGLVYTLLHVMNFM